MTIAYSGRFLVGNVFASSFEIYRRHFWSFSFLILLGFVFLFAVIVLGVLGLFLPFILDADVIGDPTDIFATASVAQISIMILVAIIAIILCLAAVQLAAAGICYGSAQDMRGQFVGFGACMVRAFSVRAARHWRGHPVDPAIGRRSEACWGLSSGLFFRSSTRGLGLLAFIPLIYLYIRFWVIVPVIVVERPGIIASFRRSLQLTRGEALRIFGLVLILVAISFVRLKIPGGVRRIACWPASSSIAVQIIITAFSAVVAAVGYVELRRAKEGFGVEDLAAVFD